MCSARSAQECPAPRCRRSPGFTDTQIWQLVSYIRSLQGPAPSAEPAAPTTGDIAAGEGLFFGRAACATCHEVNGRGGVLGPELSNAGRLSPAALQQKIVDPAAPQPAAGGRGGGRGGAPTVTVVVKMQDGREIRGVRRNEDTFSLQMIDASGQLRLLDKTKLASVTVDTGSLIHRTTRQGCRLPTSPTSSRISVRSRGAT